MKRYIKKDVIDRTATLADIDHRAANKAVTAVFNSLRDFMINSDGECRIEIRNFGVFEVKRTAAKPNARNPNRPHETIYIPPRRKTHFRPGKSLKDELRKPFND